MGMALLWYRDYGVADKDDLDLVFGNLSQDEIKNILSTYEDT